MERTGDAAIAEREPVPNDDMCLECAALANADLLVAGDKDRLILGSYLGTRIVTPPEYVGSPRA
jgi:predicted nucleic acid-binding protein